MTSLSDELGWKHNETNELKTWTNPLDTSRSITIADSNAELISNKKRVTSCITSLSNFGLNCKIQSEGVYPLNALYMTDALRFFEIDINFLEPMNDSARFNGFKYLVTCILSSTTLFTAAVGLFETDVSYSMKQRHHSKTIYDAAIYIAHNYTLKSFLVNSNSSITYLPFDTLKNVFEMDKAGLPNSTNRDYDVEILLDHLNFRATEMHCFGISSLLNYKVHSYYHTLPLDHIPTFRFVVFLNSIDLQEHVNDYLSGALGLLQLPNFLYINSTITPLAWYEFHLPTPNAFYKGHYKLVGNLKRTYLYELNSLL